MTSLLPFFSPEKYSYVSKIKLNGVLGQNMVLNKHNSKIRTHVLTVMLQPVYEAPLPIITDSVASVVSFSPGNFRRRITRPVSYYALFK